MDRLKADQPEAWDRLVEIYGPLIYGWCRQSGLQAADVADVLQETFLAVATHIADFQREGPGDSFRGWLWTITKRKVHDHFRRRQRQPQAQGGSDAQLHMAQIPDQPPDSSTTNPRSAEGSSLEHRAMKLVPAGVEDRTWQAFWCLAVDGRPVADVAEELGMSVRAVYDAKYRVRRRIRQELSGLIE